VLSVDAASLSESLSRFVGLAFHVQPNGDCYVLRFSAGGLIQLVRREGGKSRLVGSSVKCSQIKVGRIYRLEVRSDEPGVFDWSMQSDEGRNYSARVVEEETPLEGGLAGVWTNSAASEGVPSAIFQGFRLATQGEVDERPLPGALEGVETVADQLARQADEEAREQSTLTGWILTWIHDPTTTQVIDWHQEGANASTPLPFAWRKAGDSQWQERLPDRSFPFPFSSRHIHRLELTNLAPGADYEFRIGEEEPMKFRTLPGDLHEPVRIAAGGDMMGDSRVYGEINRRVAEADASFVVWGGDLAYADGRPENVGRWFDYIRIMSETLLTADRRVLPVVVGIGNHEVRGGYFWNTEYGEDGWPGTDEARERVAPFFYSLWAFPGHPGYGVLDLGDYASVIVLDTEHSGPLEGTQTEWLADVLDKRRHITHLLPVYHVPAYPSVREYDSRTSSAIRRHWVPLFEKAGVRIAFEHHDHAYKRTHPLLGDRPSEKGIVYVGDGAWGVGLRDPQTDRQYLAVAKKKHHAFLITLYPDRVEAEAMDPQGEVFDRFTVPVTGN
jgi:hypothetical protein